MSKPLNPLSNFNSYSYHHILVACSNSDVADGIIRTNNISQFERTSPQGKYSPIPFENLGGYIVLISGMTDAEFYINEVEWGSVFTPTAGPDDTYNFSATETDGEMTVIEPNGMRFINVISEAAQSLSIAAPAMIFLLKTIFVGQRGDGTAETIPGIRPIVFTLVDMSADFDYTGATYKMSIVGGRDGNARPRGPRYQRQGLSGPDDQHVPPTDLRVAAGAAIKTVAPPEQEREDDRRAGDDRQAAQAVRSNGVESQPAQSDRHGAYQQVPHPRTVTHGLARCQ